MRKLGFGINFDKEKFLWEFCKTSMERKVKPQDDWFFLIELASENEEISIEKRLVQLIFKGVQAETVEYKKYLEEEL